MSKGNKRYRNKDEDIPSSKAKIVCKSSDVNRLEYSSSNNLKENYNSKFMNIKKTEQQPNEIISDKNINSKELFEENLSVPYKNKLITSMLTYSGSTEYKENCWVILTHGAGGDMNTPQLKAIASFLASQTFTILRFTCKGLNIKYRINVFNEILKFIDEKYCPPKIFIGGRSMGCRAAVMLLSSEECRANVALYSKIEGVLCLSYPLHQVNDSSNLRDGPLKELQKPAFFLSGNQDEMCQKNLLGKVLEHLSIDYEVYWLEGYDHSAKSKMEYQEPVYLEAFSSILNWFHRNIGSKI